MLKAAKQNVLGIAKRSGALNLFMRSGFRNNRLLILAYHGVALDDEHEWNSSLFVSEEFLCRRFELLRENGCTVLPLGEAIERLYSGSLPERAVAITFDDGGYNFYAKALPVISDFRFPVTVYLTTFYSVFNRPVFPVAADYLLWKGRNVTLDLSRSIGSGTIADLSDYRERRSAQREIVNWANERALSAEEKDGLLAKIADQLSIDYEDFCKGRAMSLMDQNEVSAISGQGIDVQLHTHRHRVPFEREKFLSEINENSDIIQSMTRERPTHFCYPSGEYSEILFPWLQEAGVDSATTCDTALVGTNTNPFLIPRLVDTMPLSDVEFEGWLSGASHFLPQRSTAMNA